MSKNALIVGATGGIGAALVDELVADPIIQSVYAIARNPVAPRDGLKVYQADILDEVDLVRIRKDIANFTEPDLVIVATGILSDGADLQPEKTYRRQSLAAFERVFRINTFGPALIAKHFLPLMPRKRRAVFAVLSARVGSIADNRSGGWHAYRASKAALNMLLKNYALEQSFRNKNAIVVGLHPGTVDTGLSRPFQKGLPEGQVITPETSARSLIQVIEGLSAEDSGKVFDWCGLEIPP